MTATKIKFGVQVQAGPVHKVISQSALCEKLGFDSIWIPDHLVGGHQSLVWPELYTTLTVMGINTSKSIIGSAVTDVHKRHPAVIAQSIATLDQITNGRVAIGLGAGEDMNLLPFGINPNRLSERLAEAIRVIELLWTTNASRPANYSGKFYSLRNAYLQIKPIQNPHPPIYVGALGPKMLEITGKMANGWMPLSQTPETYRQCLDGPIKKAAESVGRNPAEIEPAFLPITQISEDRDKAREEVEKSARRFLVLLPTVLEKVDPKISHPGQPYTIAHWMGHLKKEDMEIIAKIAEQVNPEIALKTVIWGNPDDCIQQIEGFNKAGCTHFIFGIRGEPETTIRLLGTRVISYFKDRERA